MQNKKNIRTAATILLLTVIIILCFAACGRNNEQTEADASNQAEGAGPRPGDTASGADLIEDEPFFDRDQFYGETLTVSVLSRYRNFIMRFADAFMWQNPGVTVELISFGDNLSRALEETSAGLASGTAPVLMESVLVNSRHTHYFEDWLRFIDTTPDFNNDNYFMNVFDAAILNDSLYEFPLTFTFGMVAANRTIPGLTQTMEMYGDGITMSQLMELRNLMHFTGNPMYLWYNFDVNHGLWGYLQNFFNLETRMVDFNNQRFIDFISYAREATRPDMMFDSFNDLFHGTPSSVHWMGAINVECEEECSQSFLFRYMAMNRNYDFAGQIDDVLFTGATPIVSDQGDLIITPMRTHVLNAGATPVQQALAWDFMQFLVSAEGHRIVEGMGLPMLSVNRETARFTVERNWPSWDARHSSIGIRISGTTGNEAIQNTIERLIALGDMPMILAQTLPYYAYGTLRDFHYGAVSAEETAQLIQEQVEFAWSG